MSIALGLTLIGSHPFAVVLEPGPGAVPQVLTGATGADASLEWARPAEFDAAVLAAVTDAIDLATRSFGAPGSVVIVHAASWGKARVARLSRTLVGGGVASARLVSAAHASAAAFASSESRARDRALTVVALRPGGADVVAVRVDAPASIESVGASVAVPGVSEDRFDDVLLALVRSRLSEGAAAATRPGPTVMAAMRAARRRLVDDTSTVVETTTAARDRGADADRRDVHGRDADAIRVRRDDFEQRAAPLVASSFAALLSAVAASSPEIVLVTGDAAPAPLIADRLRDSLRIPVLVDDPLWRGAWAAASIAADALRVPVDPTVDRRESASPTPGGVARELATRRVTIGAARGRRAGDRPRHSLVAQLWPVGVALAGLVLFAGAAAGSTIDLSAHDAVVPPILDGSHPVRHGETGSVSEAVPTPNDTILAPPSGGKAEAPSTGKKSTKATSSHGDSGSGAPGLGADAGTPSPSADSTADPASDPAADPTDDPSPPAATDPTDPPVAPPTDQPVASGD